MSSKRHEWVADAAASGKRLDLVLKDVLSLSRAQLKGLFDAKAVWVNQRVAKKGQDVEAGQRIVVELTEEGPDDVTPQIDLPLLVLKETDDFLFLDKPSGQPTHPLRPGELGTLANALVARFPKCAQASKEPREGGVCHRLDVETSGVLLAAKHAEAWTLAREAFTQQKIDKRYWAFVNGPLADEGEIDLPLKHHPRHADRVQPALSPDDEGREARSSFQVLQRRGEFSLVEVRIYTGVLHQVRAHLAAIGAPLLGDALYGGTTASDLSRFFLHARSLAVSFPNSGLLEVHSPLPPELEAVLKARGFTELPSP